MVILWPHVLKYALPKLDNTEVILVSIMVDFGACTQPYYKTEKQT